MTAAEVNWSYIKIIELLHTFCEPFVVAGYDPSEPPEQVAELEPASIACHQNFHQIMHSYTNMAQYIYRRSGYPLRQAILAVGHRHQSRRVRRLIAGAILFGVAARAGRGPVGTVIRQRVGPYVEEYAARIHRGEIELSLELIDGCPRYLELFRDADHLASFR